VSQDYKKNALESWQRTKIYAEIATEELKQRGIGYPYWTPGKSAIEFYDEIRRYSDLHGMYTFNEIQRANPVKNLHDEEEKPYKTFKPTSYRD
jgi:hypothetical protein